MKTGDFVASHRRDGDTPAMTGIIIEVFEIQPLPQHFRVEPLPMVRIATKNGVQCWKRRKLKVINEY